jgi:hypothetical protein
VVEDGVIVATRKDAFGSGYVLYFASVAGERVLLRKKIGA